MSVTARKKELTAEQKAACERLREIWARRKDELGLTQERAAEQLGISQGALSHYLHGRNAIGMQALGKISKLLQVPAEDIDPALAREIEAIAVDFKGTSEPYTPPHGRVDFRGKSSPEPDYTDRELWEDQDPNEYVTKAEGVKLSAGSGQINFVHEEVDGSHAFKRSWLRSRGIGSVDRCRIIEVRGASMSPSLEEGDVVLVNMDDTAIKTGRVYAIMLDDELMVKRLVKAPGGAIEIQSDNPSPQFKPMTVGPDQLHELRIVGRVIWRSGEL